MCTASVYKGTALLLIHALVTAGRAGVVGEVKRDLEGSFPELMDGVERYLASSAAKAHRYVAEMHEIASAQGAIGLAPEVFEAVAAAYDQISLSPAGAITPAQAMQPHHSKTSSHDWTLPRRGRTQDGGSAVAQRDFSRTRAALPTLPRR